MKWKGYHIVTFIAQNLATKKFGDQKWVLLGFNHNSHTTEPDFDSGPEILDPDSNDYFGKMEEEKCQGTPPPKKKKITHSEERFKLLKQIAERKVAPQNEQDEADLFFGSMAKIYKRFPRKEQAELRIQITNLISNAELKMIKSDASLTSLLNPKERKDASSKANVSEFFV
ncbi:hypothetical protein TNCV_4722961 [Trichonephila clavipes]|uniref:BESS domain-containing protein n=1 Tax=Trichonephila clavipes TaxID=2585209 RepID=A0A8X6W6F3_TRICX|nr:hypothetical protein TNCV_4722961 [Trichonephila clavipes]